MFIDFAKISIKAGNGGDGCNSHYHHRRKRHITPDGGSGGKGGDVILRAEFKIHTLLDFRYRQHFKAQNGERGGSNCKKGKDAADLKILLPCGTLIRDIKTGFILRDLKNSGEEVIAAKGGLGGKGNIITHSQSEKGQLGEERDVSLELKLIADVAIVGKPNAGKSSLITAISNARPKIASYPFTTKAPILGVLACDDFSCVLVDIPGLIEGAHLGKGLGIEFLKHIERTKLVLQLVDISPEATNDPVSDFKIIDTELKSYSAGLEKKPRIIVANKIDLPGWQTNLKKLTKALGEKIISISCLEKKGLEELIYEIRRKLQTHSC
jgi:GTP-binding protein